MNYTEPTMKELEVRCLRSPDGHHTDPWYAKYTVAIEGETSILNVLYTIFSEIDSSLSFFYHGACGQGGCGRCAVKMNGKNCLACITNVADFSEITLEPAFPDRVVKDLVCQGPERE